MKLHAHVASNHYLQNVLSGNRGIAIVMVAGFLCATNLFADVKGWVGGPVSQSTLAMRARPKTYLGTTQFQQPDDVSPSGTVLPLPDGRAPLPRDTTGGPIETGQTTSTAPYEIIGINRVVSYQTDSNGHVTDPEVFNNGFYKNGVVSQYARLSIIVHIVGAPEDNDKPVKVVFNKLNGNALSTASGSPVSYTFILGQDYFAKLDGISILSSQLLFGHPKVDPMSTSAVAILNDPNSYAPDIGRNKLEYSFYKSELPSETLNLPYTAYVYAFLEFDATAPIILVHGTNADHTSWNEPKGYVEVIGQDPSISYGMFSPFVHSPDGAEGFFDAAGTKFHGTWFYRIDLDLSSNGNAGIKKTASELYNQLHAVLYALGSRTCHLIGHSKGGSDCRQLILSHQSNLAPAESLDPFELANKTKVLSLYTVCTPHRGTPLSNISKEISHYAGSVLTGQYPSISSDVRLAALTNLTNLVAFGNTFANLAPRGEARDDQMVNSRVLNDLYNEDLAPFKTNNHCYNIIGDADLDHSGSITGNEATVVSPIEHPDLLLDLTYYVVGRMGTVLIVPISNYLDVVAVPKSPTVEPNDWVVPYWSAFSKGAKVFQRNGVSNFTAPIGTSPSNGKDYSATISPGNHSIAKSSYLAQEIVGNIMLDYPLQDPTAPDWR